MKVYLVMRRDVRNAREVVTAFADKGRADAYAEARSLEALSGWHWVASVVVEDYREWHSDNY